LDNAGKTTIVRRLCDKPIDSIEPTLGFSIQTLEYDLRDGNENGDGDNGDESATTGTGMSSSSAYQLHLWDIGGQSTIRAYWRNYFEKTDGIIWVVDSGDRRRMKLVKEELDTVLEQERLAGASLLVLANKSDLEGSLGPEAIARALKLNNNNNNNNIETKTSTGSGRVTKNGGEHPTHDDNNNCNNNNPVLPDESQPNHSSRHWTIQASSAVTGEGLADSIEWLVRDITDRIYFAS
jgi:ADP-ribosylation factor-like protein 2